MIPYIPICTPCKQTCGRKKNQNSSCFWVGGEGLNGKGYKRMFCVNGHVLYLCGFRVSYTVCQNSGNV